MTTWTIIDRGRPDRLTVKYTSDDGRHSIVMPDMFWDQVTPLEDVARVASTRGLSRFRRTRRWRHQSSA